MHPCLYGKPLSQARTLRPPWHSIPCGSPRRLPPKQLGCRKVHAGVLVRRPLEYTIASLGELQVDEKELSLKCEVEHPCYACTHYVPKV